MNLSSTQAPPEEWQKLTGKEKALAETASLPLTSQRSSLPATRTVWMAEGQDNRVHRLSEVEHILNTCSEREFAPIPLGEIVPVLADRGEFINTELSFVQVLHANGQDNHNRRASPGKGSRLVTRLPSDSTKQRLRSYLRHHAPRGTF
jgi:hypothetical protein